MTNEERDIISQFIARVGGATQQSGFAAGSVPATQPALPPVDRDADAYIAQAFNQYPEARYRVTQLAFVQEHALAEAQNRIQRLEWELQQAKQPNRLRSRRRNRPSNPAASRAAGFSVACLVAGQAARKPRRRKAIRGGVVKPDTKAASRNSRIISRQRLRRLNIRRIISRACSSSAAAPASLGRR
jgi:hypothetical protein